MNATLEMYDNGTACLINGDYLAFAGPTAFVRQMAAQFGYIITNITHKTITN